MALALWASKAAAERTAEAAQQVRRCGPGAAGARLAGPLQGCRLKLRNVGLLPFSAAAADRQGLRHTVGQVAGPRVARGRGGGVGRDSTRCVRRGEAPEGAAFLLCPLPPPLPCKLLCQMPCKMSPPADPSPLPRRASAPSPRSARGRRAAGRTRWLGSA